MLSVSHLLIASLHYSPFSQRAACRIHILLNPHGAESGRMGTPSPTRPVCATVAYPSHNQEKGRCIGSLLARILGGHDPRIHVGYHRCRPYCAGAYPSHMPLYSVAGHAVIRIRVR